MRGYKTLILPLTQTDRKPKSPLEQFVAFLNVSAIPCCGVNYSLGAVWLRVSRSITVCGYEYFTHKFTHRHLLGKIFR